MKNDETIRYSYQEWVDTVNSVWVKGWEHCYGWIFYSPSGSKHNLSTADLNKLDEIERDKLFATRDCRGPDNEQ